ncbi:MAG: hypothetical protein AAGE99_02710 [Chlamydiota bacterium]
MRFLTTFIVLGGLGYGIYWLNSTQPELKHRAIEMIDTDRFYTLENRFTAAQIIEKERLKEFDHRYRPPSLRFRPYLLMEVKFTTPDRQTEEGMILWDLIDGEMVLDTKSWDKTHGFADCINAGADKYEYKILVTIAKNGGKANRQSLMRSLNLETHFFEKWVERARKKKLIVQHGDDYRIHLHHPVVDVPPSTMTTEPLVAKSCRSSDRINRRYSPKQIKKAAEAAFGNDFAIRSTQDVSLPIYSITLQNRDGSLRTTHWNAFNGKRLNRSNFIE